jgi:3-deoxy-D-manno-octulosonic-acid transferase
VLKLYSRLVPCLGWLLQQAAPFFSGVEDLLAPRRELLARWRKAELGENRIWFHVSSVGELEQVRPVLEILGRQGFSLCLTYFSSSVPRLVKDWDFVNHADYLPLDFAEEMEELMAIIRPRLLVLNRYDLWPHHLAAARRRGVPVVVVNASTPPLSFFGKIGLFFRRELFRQVNAWTFVDSVAAAAWEPYVHGQVKGLVTGDPRVDRSLARVEIALGQGKARQALARWKKRTHTLVAGSTWPEDEEVLLAAWKAWDAPRSLLLVPHEPTEEHLISLEKMITAAGFTLARYSSLAERETSADVLLVDQRGILAELYAYGEMAFVGGGFRRQIHSIIEPVSHGLPVAFGPNFQRSPEAVALRAAGSALSIQGREAQLALRIWLEEMSRPGEVRQRAEEPLRVFLQIHRGAGERVAEFLLSCLKHKPAP